MAAEGLVDTTGVAGTAVEPFASFGSARTHRLSFAVGLNNLGYYKVGSAPVGPIVGWRAVGCIAAERVVDWAADNFWPARKVARVGFANLVALTA